LRDISRSKTLAHKSDDVSKDKTFSHDTPTYKIHLQEKIEVYDKYHHIIYKAYVTHFRNNLFLGYIAERTR